MPSFTVTAAGQKISLDSSGSGQAAFTVTNTSTTPLRGRLVATPQPPAAAEWLAVEGEPIRDFAPGAAEQVTVKVAAPAATAAGSYSFRLDAVSEVNPDEDFTQGPSVSFDVAAAQPKKPFPWWILIVALIVVIGIAVLVFVILPGDDGEGGEATPTPTPTTTPTAVADLQTVEYEAEDLLPAVPPTNAEFVHRQPNCCGVTWSADAQVFFRTTSPGQLVVRFEVPRTARYAVSAAMTKAPDYGILTAAVDGEQLGNPFDGFNPGAVTITPVTFGDLELAEGVHRLTLSVIGKHPASSNFFAGIDTLTLRPVQRLRMDEIRDVEREFEERSP